MFECHNIQTHAIYRIFNQAAITQAFEKTYQLQLIVKKEASNGIKFYVGQEQIVTKTIATNSNLLKIAPTLRKNIEKICGDTVSWIAMYLIPD